jgi:hypothetical protein
LRPVREALLHAPAHVRDAAGSIWDEWRSQAVKCARRPDPRWRGTWRAASCGRLVKPAEYRAHVRVLHGTYEIAGQGMVLAEGPAGDWRRGRLAGVSRRLGRPRAAASWSISIASIPVRRVLAMNRTRRRLESEYDVVPLPLRQLVLGSAHPTAAAVSSRASRPQGRAGAQAAGKTVVYHFHGCEVRNRAWMIEHHARAACTECRPFCDPARQRHCSTTRPRHADRVFFSTKDLAESVPNGIELPLAIESARWEEAARAHPLPDPDRRDGVHGPVVIAHAPTARWIKGTRHVEDAFERLRGEFPRLELRLIEKLPWAEMPRALAGCDLLVDQLFIGLVRPARDRGDEPGQGGGVSPARGLRRGRRLDARWSTRTLPA